MLLRAYLAVLPLTPTITGLYDEFCGEDVCQLSTIAIAPTCHLFRGNATTLRTCPCKEALQT